VSSCSRRTRVGKSGIQITKDIHGREIQEKIFSKRDSEKTHSRKKEQGVSPARKIVSTLFARNLNFALHWRGDAACARQGSSRDLDHQTLVLRPACPIFVDQISHLVIIFGNECSKFEQFAK
jgi:hypothetical protein